MNPPIKNVTPPPGGGPRGISTPTARSRQNQILILAVFVIVLVLLVRACSGHENKYEHIAHELTQGVQNNDYNAIAKLENPETASDMRRERLGKASDQLAPLGKIKRVHEVPTTSKLPRVHEFDVTFEKGSAHEVIQFDPTDKVFHFHEDVTPPK